MPTISVSRPAALARRVTARAANVHMRLPSLFAYPVIGAAVAVARTVRVSMPRIGTRIPGRVTVTVTETCAGVAVTVPVWQTWARNADAAASAAAGSMGS